MLQTQLKEICYDVNICERHRHTKIPSINIYMKYNYSTTMCRTFLELLVQRVTNTTEKSNISCCENMWKTYADISICIVDLSEHKYEL
jgi:hypothetical protein